MHPSPLLLSYFSDAQCLTGFVANVTSPNIMSSKFISGGFYLFPTAKFECSGRILGLQGRALFDTLLNDYVYGGTLVLSLQLWKEEQDHYTAPLQNHTVTLSTAQIYTAVPIDSGLFYFSQTRTFSIRYSLDEAIEVEAGDVLGIYLPPTGTFADNVVVNGIPLLIADGPDIRVRGPTSCWSPTQGRFVCHQLQPSTGLPLLSFEFERGPEVTSKLF